MAPVAAAQAFFATIPGSAPYRPLAGYYTFPCTATLSISLSFAGSTRQHAIDPRDFNLGYIDYPNGNCLAAYIGQNTGLGTRTIVGDVFMKSWYTSFDVTNSRIGLATPV